MKIEKLYNKLIFQNFFPICQNLTPALNKREGLRRSLVQMCHQIFFPCSQAFQSHFAIPWLRRPLNFFLRTCQNNLLHVFANIGHCLKKKGRCCMNLQIFWRILHYPWGEVLFKIFSYQTETVTSVSDLLRADITQRLCKGNASDSAWTGYQSITENFIKWNRSRKTWQARNHPFITVCQLLSYVDFMISPSYPPSQQINHIPRGTLMGGNWHTVCTFKKKINTKVYHKIHPAWFKVWSLP